MNILENIRSAISSVFANKTRTLLTAIGIIIGVSSVIIITSIGSGFEKTMEKQFEVLNDKALQVYPSAFGGSDATLSLKDVSNIKEHENVKYVAGYESTRASLRLKNPSEEKLYNVLAVDPDFAIMQKNFFDIRYGRTFSERENENKDRVAVIDENIALEVFGRKDVVNEEVNFYINDNDYTFRIIGVTAPDPQQMGTNYIKMPLRTALDIFNKETFEMLYIELNNADNIKLSQRELVRIIASNHNTKDDNYYIMSNREQIDSVKKVINTFTIFVGFVAGISLLVGGIGVMNIMLVTVTERTREIGIRKSLGATSGNIKTQFLIESMFLCSLGGIIGIIVGYFGGKGIGSILGNLVRTSTLTLGDPIFSLPVALGAMLISVTIGVIFGVYPAGKAAKLDPIEALRFE
ncbi:MAG: ABC transporter permease [Eubacteriales bacterium]|nr:ABC transporter permease [Eubacteriales bacterium]